MSVYCTLLQSHCDTNVNEGDLDYDAYKRRTKIHIPANCCRFSATRGGNTVTIKFSPVNFAIFFNYLELPRKPSYCAHYRAHSIIRGLGSFNSLATAEANCRQDRDTFCQRGSLIYISILRETQLEHWSYTVRANMSRVAFREHGGKTYAHPPPLPASCPR